MNKTGCLIVLGFIIVVGVMCALTSCCANTCGQGAPELREMPEHGIYVIEDVIEIPVTPSGK
jgi:hypothetical protein